MSHSTADLRASLHKMFHDLRSPLGPVIGFAQLLRDGKAGPLTDQQREFLDDILKSGRQLLATIEETQREVIATLGPVEGPGAS
ncbi:MAG TPA: histidine kinase dimerization/phospho-acceptor domain-containing protein [Candidatus Tumulicola sp.]|nr:histidine kinase dimerization/phospho-acceptor domain-containing protein [Candidatus Tumulicola sp.]